MFGQLKTVHELNEKSEIRFMDKKIYLNKITKY